MKTEDYIEINKRAYDALASDYKNRLFRKGEYEEPVQNLVDFSTKHLDQNKDGPILALEIGPGSGEVLREFEKRGFRTVAVEISEKIIEVARETSPSSLFVNSNVLEADFWAEQFDIIYAGAVVHLFKLKDANSFLKKARKWMKNDGFLFVNTTVHKDSSEGYLTKTDYSGNVARFRRNWKENDFIRIVKECGYIVVEKSYTNEKDRGKKWIGLLLAKDR